MEQINRIELRGTVGTVRVQEVGETHVAKISLVTEFVYKGREGEPVIETTWHYITAWEGRNMMDLSTIRKGSKLQVLGRLRGQHYTGNDGVERYSYEILASRMELVNTDEILQCMSY